MNSLRFMAPDYIRVLSHLTELQLRIESRRRRRRHRQVLHVTFETRRNDFDTIIAGEQVRGIVFAGVSRGSDHPRVRGAVRYCQCGSRNSSSTGVRNDSSDVATLTLRNGKSKREQCEDSDTEDRYFPSRRIPSGISRCDTERNLNAGDVPCVLRYPPREPGADQLVFRPFELVA
jgi:hypothetical protein